MKRSRTFLALAAAAGFLFAACSGGTASQAPAEMTDVRLQLQWAPQAQFAGYFAAQGEGYFEDEGLNVTFVPGGPDVIPQVAGSAADGPEFAAEDLPDDGSGRGSLARGCREEVACPGGSEIGHGATSRFFGTDCSRVRFHPSSLSRSCA